MNPMLIKSGFSTGEVAFIDLKMKDVKNKDYGYRILVTMTENSFFVIKYQPNGSTEVKSIKFFMDMPLDIWKQHNTAISPYDSRPDKPKDLEGFLLREEEYAGNENFTPTRTYKGITKNTEKFFDQMDDEMGNAKYHSFYGDGDYDTENSKVMRFAFTTDGSLNSVIKKWFDSDVPGPTTIKFDATDISIMSKEWRMKEIPLTTQGTNYLVSLGDAIIFDKDNPTDEEDSNSDEEIDDNIDQQDDVEEQDEENDKTEEVEKYFQSEIFGYSGITPLYFKIGDDLTIVLTIKGMAEPIYAIWAYKGGEDHRITLSAKGFDVTLPTGAAQLSWSTYKISEDEFIEEAKSLGDTVNDVRLSFSKHCYSWSRNMQLINIVRL